MANMIDLKIVEEHIAVVTLQRPEAANALSKTLLQELNDVIQKINEDPNVYCTVITGAGDKVFCAGADLKERKGMSEEQVIAAVESIGETFTAIDDMQMPVIAALNGSAYGGGLELALACDLRVAVKHAKIGLTETSLAIIPGAGGTQRLTRLIGLGQAKRLIFTAQSIAAQEAFTISMVEQLSEQEYLLDDALQLAKTIIRNGPIALRQAKAAIDTGIQTDISTGLAIEHLCYKKTIPTADRIEGLTAFKEKRKPAYQGK